MNFDKLVEKLERNESVYLDEIQGVLPETTHPCIKEIYGIIGSVKKTAYLVSVTDFYEPQETALKVIHHAIPRHGEWVSSFNFKSFYHGAKDAYERRCKNGISHDPELLKCELDFSGRGILGVSKSHYVADSSPPPSWDNAVRRIEGN
ncbi:MAG: hypothetical protein V1802_00525 [Candidatus Aenigmatarchaeota archaeon]